MMGPLLRSEGAAFEKPFVAVIGDSEDLLGTIGSDNSRFEFIHLTTLGEEPNIRSVHDISCLILCGLDWHTQFLRVRPSEELGVVVVVNDLDEYAAALRDGALAVLVRPVSNDLLYSQIESQLHLVGGQRRSVRLLRGQSEILEMIASGAERERIIEALALMIETIEPHFRCAISTIDSDGAAFANVCAPSLSRICKVHLLQTPVAPPLLDSDWLSRINRSENFPVNLALYGEWRESAWAKALRAEGFQTCVFIPVLNSRRQPLAILSLFGSGASDSLNGDSQLIKTATHFIGIAFEKSEREENLGAERERLSMALAAGKLGVWSWDLITNELIWSEQCKLFFGYSDHSEITFQHFLAALHPGDRDRTMKAIEESIRKDVPYDIEYRVVHPDGTVRWISAIGRTFRDDFDRPTRMGGVARDVTAKRQFDEELQENQARLRSALNAAELARREAETAIRAKDQFLAVLSHELRTPLTPIMLAASWLRNAQDLSEQARNAFEMIFRNVELEARLIDDLLDLTRIERNQLELQFRTVDLHTVLRAALEVCETGVQEKKQSLILHLAAARALVACDVARLQQVFWNLLKNAIKFTPERGSIRVTSRNEKNYIAVEVSDSGIGIDPSIIPKIFVAFEQGDKEIVKQFGGLGLGLAISKAIIDAHEGTIAVHSEGRNLGSAFTVRLRLANPKQSENIVQE
jgi:PAS domain S-box-containing protein